MARHWQRGRPFILLVLLIVGLALTVRWLPPLVKSAQATQLARSALPGRSQPTPLAPALPGTLRFAAIGDYGGGGQAEAAVAALVASWNPDFVITQGDNNYPAGEATTIDPHIGQFYHDYIFPYTGSYGAGAAENRFFPALGNHDWITAGAQPYLAYFTLPGNERYYDFVRGAVHFFAVDSDSHEPDGITASSTQALWLQTALAAAPEPWKLVYFHHAPYSSSAHGSNTTLQWPFAAWGATAVLAGHDHSYERILMDGFPYFVNGLGGYTIYAFGAPVAGSEARFNSDFGAMLLEATETQLTFQFITQAGVLVDTFSLTAPVTLTPTATATPTDTPTATATPTPLPCCDFNGDGEQDVIDVQIAAVVWMTPNPHYDFNGNGVVDIYDIGVVVAAWKMPLATPIVSQADESNHRRHVA